MVTFAIALIFISKQKEKIHLNKRIIYLDSESLGPLSREFLVFVFLKFKKRLLDCHFLPWLLLSNQLDNF